MDHSVSTTSLFKVEINQRASTAYIRWNLGIVKHALLNIKCQCRS